MDTRAWARAAILASALALPMLAGCKDDSNVEKGRDSEVPALAPGSPSGLNSSQVDRGAAGGTSEKAP
jgi:hypothetical protein